MSKERELLQRCLDEFDYKGVACIELCIDIYKYKGVCKKINLTIKNTLVVTNPSVTSY